MEAIFSPKISTTTPKEKICNNKMRIFTQNKTTAMKHFILLPGLLSISTAIQMVNAQTQPNFIIILADDMGYGDTQMTGSTLIHTPNLQQMLQQGLSFTDFHANGAVSSPTRCALLTGRYQQRAGLENVILVTDAMDKIQAGLQPGEVTFAQVLADNGYNTALVGKWHLGYQEQSNPLNFGFQRFIGFKSGNVDYQSHRNRRGDPDWWDGLQLQEMPGYTTTLLTDLSCDYIREHKDSTFCLYIAHAAPHSPLQGPTDPAVRDGVKKGDKAGTRPNQEIYKEMVEELDRSVGKVLQCVKECGIAENTLVVFFSDNGPVSAYGGSSGSWRGEKGSIWEGGHRSVAIMQMPGTIKAGSQCEETVMGFDLFPTFLDMAGIQYDDSQKPLDGVSIRPLLQGVTIAPRTLFWGIGKQTYAVRDGEWKLTRHGAKTQLFNLKTDPAETTDVAALHPELAKQLNAKLAEWKASVYSETPIQ